MSEQGHAKNVEEFKRLKNFAVGWGAAYHPTNAALGTANMAAIIVAAEAVIDGVRGALVPRKNVVAHREDVFAPARETAARVVGMLEASGAPASVIEDARTFQRKIAGRRKKEKPKDDPLTLDVDESKASISASQQSFTQIVEAFDNLVALAAAQPIYNPNEDDLKIDNLQILSDNMRDANNAVIAADTAFSNALAARDQVLYAKGSGLCDIAALTKKYVFSAFGADSPEYNQIKGLEFKKR